MKFRLPWPDRGLSPNARRHWRTVAVLKRGAREYAYWVTRTAMTESGVKQRSPATKRSALPSINVTLTFFPPDRRKRDLDNAIAAFKASQDGVADALGVDDSRWNVTYRLGEPEKGGAVLVEVLP